MHMYQKKIINSHINVQMLLKAFLNVCVAIGLYQYCNLMTVIVRDRIFHDLRNRDDKGISALTVKRKAIVRKE